MRNGTNTACDHMDFVGCGTIACGEDDLARRRFFLQKTEQIPASWVASREKAKQNGDVEKMHIESIKLDTVLEIKNMCMQIWEEAT